MPTYEYRCESCQHEFEELQSFKDEPLKVCPKCHHETLRRLFGTGAAILFKGSGFYETDYRSDSYKKAAKAEKDASSSKTADSSSSDGGKSAAKTESPKTETTKPETKSKSPDT